MANRQIDVQFKNDQEEYEFNLVRAEVHLRRALELANKVGAPKRSLVCKTLLARAHGIVTGLYTQEARDRRNR